MQWGLVKQGVVLPHKFAANALWTWGFHNHDFELSSNLKKYIQVLVVHRSSEAKFVKDPIYRTKVIVQKRPYCQKFYL